MALLRLRNRLRETRKATGKSAYDLSLLSNIPTSTIYSIERGLRAPLEFEKALLSEALGVPVDEVFPHSMKNSRKIVDASEIDDPPGRKKAANSGVE